MDKKKTELVSGMFSGCTFQDSVVVGVAEEGSTVCYKNDGKQTKQEVPKDKKTSIMEYVDRLKPVVKEAALPIYDEVWLEILELDEVRCVVYNRGRQQGTIFNRDFVATIVHVMSQNEIISGNDSELAVLLEPERGVKHPVRGQLGLPPDKKVKKAVEGVLERHGLKVSES